MRLTPRARRGVTLIEVVVAVFLFAVACLALIGSQSALTSFRTRALHRWGLASTAQTVLDSLRASACGALSSGSHRSREGTVAWTATPRAGVVELQLAVAPALVLIAPWQARTLVPCRP
jgi:prepilin-type N-terminal cleavage/methylation domain-containing protein